ncbi:MAG: DNA cytosine methyltransferase [Candidatus Aenigmarchaeota archaeon]|nr:DNA cytosine methyltransferase [Candidatus Aenigmarchaeota archaeon]
MFNVVDLFAGPGGLSLGFELARVGRGRKIFNTLACVEIDPWACKTLRKNFPKSVIVEGDIRRDDIKEYLEKICKKKTDILVGGPPCQSFSTIGPRSGNSRNKKDKYRYDGLYREFIDVAEKLSPKFVVFENVKGILSKRNGDEKVIDIIISELEKLGYNLESENKRVTTKYVILNAADYGVPQTRERVFIIGNNIGTKNPFPYIMHYDPRKGVSLNKEMLPYVTIRDAIGDLPAVKPKKTVTHINEKRVRQIEKYNKKIYSGTEKTVYKKVWSKCHLKIIGKSGQEFFRFVRPNLKIPLTHHVARSQMETDIKLFQGMKEGMAAKDVIESNNPGIRKLSEFIRYDMKSFRDKYKKQSWNRPSSTVFSHMQKDGNRFIHPDSKQARTFTPREAARMQSFPDNFYFEGPMTKKFQQIGNAVPPLLAKRICEGIYYKLANISL